MNKVFFFAFTLFTLSIFNSCGDDEEIMEEVVGAVDFDYQANILSPTIDDKKVGDLLHIHIDFESLTSETVHHVKVTLTNISDGTVIYSKPDDAHVHQEDGTFEYQDDFMLSNENGITEHTDWILEAKVWAHEAGLAETVETIQFHVHPN